MRFNKFFYLLLNHSLFLKNKQIHEVSQQILDVLEAYSNRPFVHLEYAIVFYTRQLARILGLHPLSFLPSSQQPPEPEKRNEKTLLNLDNVII